MADFQQAIEKLFYLEGGYSPRDNTAGAVNYGITQRFLKNIGVDVSAEMLKLLTKDEAKYLYLEHFWVPLKLHEFPCQRLAEELFEAAVNMGPVRPVQCLQVALNTLGADLKVDGKLGPMTLATVRRYAGKPLLDVFLANLRVRYLRIAASNPAEYGDDLKGWLKRLEDNVPPVKQSSRNA